MESDERERIESIKKHLFGDVDEILFPHLMGDDTRRYEGTIAILQSDIQFLLDTREQGRADGDKAGYDRGMREAFEAACKAVNSVQSYEGLGIAVHKMGSQQSTECGYLTALDNAREAIRRAAATRGVKVKVSMCLGRLYMTATETM